MTSSSQDFGAAAKPKLRPLDAVIARHPIPTWRPLAWAIMILLGFLGFWASEAKLDTVAVAEGEVKPQGETRIVQHLEGGIIQELLVREGERVEKGQTLLRLDADTSSTNRDELLVRLDGLRLQRARFEAERSGSPLSLPDEIANARPLIAEAERQTYESSMTTLRGEITILENQERQKRQEIDELAVKRAALVKDRNLTRERYETSLPLLERKLVTRLEILDLEREMERLEGELKSLDASLPRARSALAEAQERRRSLIDTFRSDAASALSETELEIARNEQLLNRADRQAGRYDIRAPIEGVVNVLYFNTIGGVVRPGEPIIEIVPSRDKLIVEARVNPIDIGYIRPGMPATVKITTYDFIRYGSLKGEIITVAADIETDDATGAQFFPIIVETEETQLSSGEARYEIFPGMQATVDLHLGDKTVMEFLLQPVIKMRLEAFRER